MASYQSPGASLVALLRVQLEQVGDGVLSSDARRCLVGYARHLERKGLSREGDHLLAGLLLNAVEIALYLPTGKAGRGILELTRLQERVERTQTAAKRAERRLRRGAEQKEPGSSALWQSGRRVQPAREPANGEQEAGDVSAEDAAEAAGGTE